MPNEPAPAASTWWKCKCPEYNNHRGIFSCSKCGASSSDEPVPTNDTPPKAQYVARCTCGDNFGGQKPLCPVHEPSPEVTVTTASTSPKAKCQNCKNGCYFVNDEPCRCPCHAAKAQTVPELVVDLQEYFSVWHRERTQWHSNITDLAIQQHYAEIGRKLDTRFPAIAEYLLSQEAELTRLRGERVYDGEGFASAIRTTPGLAEWFEQCPDLRMFTQVVCIEADRQTSNLLSPSPRATP